MTDSENTAEEHRLSEDVARTADWKRWGPYLSERQWGTVREDYSDDGDVWESFPHDHARSRAYRWGEDGLLGITDRKCRLCFALALWNGQDTILKERLFGLTGPEGNHGEDVKECYYYLDSTPTHSWMQALYRYPQRRFPYTDLLNENQRRGYGDLEFELTDTDAFSENRYFDIQATYAKAAPDDILIEIELSNRGPETATLHVLPTVWFRNAWSWGCEHEGCEPKPWLYARADNEIKAGHASLGQFSLRFDPADSEHCQGVLFTENETNTQKLFGTPPAGPYVKDAFHRFVIDGESAAVNPHQRGTKAAIHYRLVLPPDSTTCLRLRLSAADGPASHRFGENFTTVFERRRREADEYYDHYAERRLSGSTDEEARNVARQSAAGLMWTKQFYHFAVREWLGGDPESPSPPESRRGIRNDDWSHLFNRDVISMPDKWEYPWYAAWDLAFHMLPFADLDPHFAREQLLLFLREWYMHPNGQIPAYEWNFSDVNPPVHAWGCWRVYKIAAARGHRDVSFLKRCFHKLLLNFNWWVNRKDVHGQHLFSGGFLGLDNIGVFDRSKPLPTGGHLEQADGTAWMAFYCGTMLSIALELASHDSDYEDVASKFFEHYVAIADAMNTLGGSGLWDEQDGFYYDRLHIHDEAVPLRTRSMVGLVPLFAAEILEEDVIERLPEFRRRMDWFLNHRSDLASQVTLLDSDAADHAHRLLAIPSRERLERVLRYLFDENEFLSPYGIRSLSKVHADQPYVLHADGVDFRVDYVPGESNTGMFGGNSNWRGPVWFPMNYLILEALQRYHYFYGDDLTVEYPTGSGQRITLQAAANDLARRLCSLFMPDESGRRPCHGDDARYANDPHWKNQVLFYEYFHGDDGRGVGASHQTGWTALVMRLLRHWQ